MITCERASLASGCEAAGATSRGCARRRPRVCSSVASTAARSSGRVDIERQRGHLDGLDVDPGGGGVFVVAIMAAGAEGGLPGHPGGVRTSALVPGAVAVGHDQQRRRGHRAREQLVELGRAEQRAVAGHHQHPIHAQLAAPAPPLGRPPGYGRGPGPRRPSRHSRRRSAGRRCRRRRPAPGRRASARRSAIRTSENIASTSARRGVGSSSARRRCLASSKLLMGRTARVVTAGTT